MIPGANHTHELVIVRHDDGRAQRWNTYPTRVAADAERIRLAKHGFYCVVRAIDDATLSAPASGGHRA